MPCFAALVAAALFSFATGCGHPTVEVSAANTAPALTASPSELPGVPFYVKHGMCKRETVWAEPRYTLQVNVLAGDKTAASRSSVLSRSYLIENTGSKGANSNLEKLLKDLNALAAARQEADLGGLCPKDVAATWETVAREARDSERKVYCEEANDSGCEHIADGESSGDLIRLVNTANVVTEVDYEHVYYMNTRTPWIGNASADTKLNSDGTLSEGNIVANDQTWSTILGTIGSVAGDVASFGTAAVTGVAPVASAATTPAPANEEAVGPRVGVGPPPQTCAPEPGWPMPGVVAVKASASHDSEAAPEAEAPATAKNKPDATPKADKKPTPPKAEASTSYQVSMQASGYLHDHVKETTGLGSQCIPDSAGVTDGSVTITKQDGGATKDDDSAIKVSGKVTLPKAGDAKK
jgi:hypothetical protein